jgi:hypothetical protein
VNFTETDNNESLPLSQPKQLSTYELEGKFSANVLATPTSHTVAESFFTAPTKHSIKYFDFFYEYLLFVFHI